MKEDVWLSPSKIEKMFNISTEKLNELEKDGKVKTILVSGNKKLYLASSLGADSASKEKPSFFKKLLLKFFLFK